MDKASKTYHRHLKNAESNPGLIPTDTNPRAFAASKTYAEHHDLVDRVFDMKTLDPAMGSGHFLVETVDFITDRLLDFLNRYPRNPVRFMLDKTRRSILDALGGQGVTVDPDKLTDINLLKRHVLKRCIYGVDLNPMAVELAKVSLWLDAFTLGAPLSFLDHHLRCGNSLIGATFDDLKKATEGQLFAIDYQPLLRAIQHVLFVNAMADATAAEVHQSASEYAQARKELSGYKIVLDLLVADHFMNQSPKRQRGVSSPTIKPSSLLKEAQEIDLTSRSTLMDSLDEQASLMLAQAEAVARRADLRFFHWEIEFPEVFFGFADSEQRQLKHKNDIAEGTAGFDAVVGNPPYVRVELLDAVQKDYMKQAYSAVVDRCDIYVGFIQKELSVIARTGLAGLIVSSQFCTTDYGRRLRQVLSSTRAIKELIDLTPLQVFDGALTYPAIIVMSVRPQARMLILSMASILPRELPPVRHETLFAANCKRGMLVDSEDIYDMQAWSVEALSSLGAAFVLPKGKTTTLGALSNISSSMKSGRDDVLAGRLIEKTRNRLVLQPARSDKPLTVNALLWREVIRPKDLLDDGTIREPSRFVFWPYRNADGDGFELISETECRALCGATWSYMSSHRTLLEARRDSGKSWLEHGRPWYSLGRIGKPSDYAPPKLLSPGEFEQPRFCVSCDHSLFPCARIIGISGLHVPWRAVLAFLQSRFAAAWLRANLPPKGGGFRGMSVGHLSRLPVPGRRDEIWQDLATAEKSEVDRIVESWQGKP